MALKFYSLKVKEIIRETEKTVSIVFEIPKELEETFSYRAGQYLTIKKEINGEAVRRSYSISSSAAWNEDLQISSKKLEGGKMSTFLWQDLSAGDELEVMPPLGNFVLTDQQAPLVLFAAGSGITPLFSILKEALKVGEQLIHLYYGNRSEEEVIFSSALKELQDQYPNRLMVQHYFSSDGERLDAERAQSLLTALGTDEKEQAQFYICGPSGMIEAVKIGLEKGGISPGNIQIEYFTSNQEQDTDSEETAISDDLRDITVVLDEEEHQLKLEDGEFILDGASRIGIDPPFSCQSGVCTTCKAKLLRGEVEMENNFGLGEDEIEEGFVLTCIGKPKTPGVKVSWDEV